MLIMFLVPTLLVTLLLNLSLCTAADSLQDTPVRQKHVRPGVNSLTTLIKPKHLQVQNVAPVDKLLVTEPIEHHKTPTKKHDTKKSPKRTIQKIIKKAKKTRKVLLNQMTSMPTKSTFPIKEEQPTEPTTQATQKKKVKKWNSKYVRHPLPFQKLQSRKDSTHHRMKREYTNRNYIVKSMNGRKVYNRQKSDRTMSLSYMGEPLVGFL